MLQFGTSDQIYPPAVEEMKTQPDIEFVPLEGLGRVSAFYRLDIVLPHIRRFLAEVGED
jgi:hypothetical protein